jgi:hypothetical protein
MKLKRDEFKVMLKECILELVQEGKIFQNGQRPAFGGPSAHQVADEYDGESPQNTRLNEAVRMTTQLVSKGDPKKAALFESIIADTARTTLQKQLTDQLSGGGMLTGGAALPEEREFDKQQLGMFAANNRWATLAFGSKPKNTTG